MILVTNREKNPQEHPTFSYTYYHEFPMSLYKVAHGAIFMEQKMRFGLILCQLAILKKRLGADHEQL